MRFGAAAAAMIEAVSCEPVNEMRETPGWAVSAAPTSSP